MGILSSFINFNYKKCSTDLDWVFVLTPNKTHYKICEFFLKKGVNVFCEKPLTLSYEESQNTEVLNEDEQDSLQVGEKMEAQQEPLLAGKYKDAEELEKAYLELQTKLGEKPSEDKVEESEPEDQAEPETKE